MRNISIRRSRCRSPDLSLTALQCQSGSGPDRACDRKFRDCRSRRNSPHPCTCSARDDAGNTPCAQQNTVLKDTGSPMKSPTTGRPVFHSLRSLSKSGVLRRNGRIPLPPGLLLKACCLHRPVNPVPLIGFGGTHYATRETEIALTSRGAFGHIAHTREIAGAR